MSFSSIFLASLAFFATFEVVAAAPNVRRLDDGITWSSAECAKDMAEQLDSNHTFTLVRTKHWNDIWYPLYTIDTLQDKYCTSRSEQGQGGIAIESKSGANDLVCTIDVATAFPGDHELLRMACGQAGGVFLSNTYTETCEGITFEWKNGPICLPESCSLADNEAILQYWSNQNATSLAGKRTAVFQPSFPRPQSCHLRPL